MPELLLTIPVESVESKRKGYLKLFRCSDVIHFVQYQDQIEFINTEIDKVLVEVQTCQATFHGDSSVQHSFRFINRNYLDLFSHALYECQEICNLTLALSSRLRDVYYSGLCGKSIFPDGPSKLCSDEILILQNSAAEELIHQNMKSSTDYLPYYPTSSNTRDKSNNLMQTLPSPMPPFQPPGVGSGEMSNVGIMLKRTNDTAKCFYCGIQSSDSNNEINYYIHPYVPVTFDQKPMVMCSVCIENWNDFRERAELDGNLILPDEINEELCCLCSDTPDELILCSKCQRSYCDQCLKKTVTDPKAYQEITAHVDWLCFCCKNKVPAKQFLTRDAWKFWITPSSGGNVGHGKKGSSSNHKSLISDKKSRGTNSVEFNLFNKANGLKISNSKNSKEEGLVSFNPIGEKNSPFPVLGAIDSNGIAPESTTIKKAIIGFSPNNSHKSRSKGNKTSSVSLDSATNTPNAIDEVYYFGQYLLNLEDSYGKLDELINNSLKPGKASKKPLAFTTDEVCFLCKDGGDLIECDDFCNMKGKHSMRCLKVYHSYCLDFHVEDNVKWCCPRHFCSCCGSKQLKYMCMFCPISVCGECPNRFVETYGLNRFCEIIGKRVGEYSAADIIPIACENCMVLLEKAKVRMNLDISNQIYTKLGPEKTFTELSLNESDLNQPDSAVDLEEPVIEGSSSGVASNKKKRRRST